MDINIECERIVNCELGTSCKLAPAGGDNGKEAFIEPKLIDIGEANQKYAPPFDN